jgi:hypothetical protein
MLQHVSPFFKYTNESVAGMALDEFTVAGGRGRYGRLVAFIQQNDIRKWRGQGAAIFCSPILLVRYLPALPNFVD